MDSNSQKIVIERLIDAIPVHYFLSSLFICIIVFSINVFYMKVILNPVFSWISLNDAYSFMALFMIPYFYQLVAIKYLLNTTRYNFKKLEDIICAYNTSCFQIKLIIYNKNYLVAIFAIIIFITYLDMYLRKGWSGFFPMYNLGHGQYQYKVPFLIIADIWNNCFQIIYAFLIATSFWLFLNFSSLLNRFRNDALYSKTSDFTAHIHEIATIRGLIMRYFLINIVSIYLFLFFIFYWDFKYEIESNGVIQGTIFSIENISISEGIVLALMAALFLAAILLLFVCLDAIRKFIKKLTNNEVALIEAKYYKQIQELVNFLPSDNYDDSAKRLNYLSNYADILKKEKDRIGKSINLTSYIKFMLINVDVILTTVVIPIATLYVELRKLQ